jgi:hypothetical protein
MAGYSYPNLPYKEVNPNNEPIGHFTGRCGTCGSKDLWKDNQKLKRTINGRWVWYSCNNCGGSWGEGSAPAPRLVPNGS